MTNIKSEKQFLKKELKLKENEVKLKEIRLNQKTSKDLKKFVHLDFVKKQFSLIDRLVKIKSSDCQNFCKSEFIKKVESDLVEAKENLKIIKDTVFDFLKEIPSCKNKTILKSLLNGLKKILKQILKRYN